VVVWVCISKSCHWPRSPNAEAIFLPDTTLAGSLTVTVGDHVERTGKPLIDDEVVDCPSGRFFSFKLTKVAFPPTEQAVSLPTVIVLRHPVKPRMHTSCKSWAFNMFPRIAASYPAYCIRCNVELTISHAVRIAAH
jgi:hypothetical protein